MPEKAGFLFLRIQKIMFLLKGYLTHCSNTPLAKLVLLVW
jgi:hypothetical protein